MGRTHLKEFIRFKKDAKHVQKDVTDKSVIVNVEPVADEKSGGDRVDKEEVYNVQVRSASEINLPNLSNTSLKKNPMM